MQRNALKTKESQMKQTQAVGIDLGTTYSCVASLNEYGQPVTIPNQEGELATPSVVFFDEDIPIVGTEALRHAVSSPDHVVQHAKRFMGDAQKFWKIGNTRYSPVHISGMVLRKLVAAAQERLGEINEAVITVPAQFSDAQRHATIQAGHAAGLERIEMINEPVAAALCHVLGNEGLAFTELAIDQQLLVYDLGGGTIDLAVVRYSSDEVRVVASDGDLELGGLDWTDLLADAAAEKFLADIGDDPRQDRESLQHLQLEAEQAKRSLSVRPRTAITILHKGHRRTYQIEQTEFEQLSRKLVKRCEEVTKRILKDNGFGWAHIDVVLTTGGASRMPMIRQSLKKLSGRTLNSTLSPDQSIAHGAAYYAGMLLANQQYARTVFNSQASSRLAQIRQQSVNARALGILIRDEDTGERMPHYLIPANSPLPASRTHVFGTVVDNQQRVHVRIVESGAGADRPPVVLGECVISDLPPNLPEGSQIEVTISYDRNAQVHVSAVEPVSGRSAEAEIIRRENVSGQLEQQIEPDGQSQQPAEDTDWDSPQIDFHIPANQSKSPGHVKPDEQEKSPQPASSTTAALQELSQLANTATPSSATETDQPVLLCNKCGEALGRGGKCSACGHGPTPAQSTGRRGRSKTAKLPAGTKPASGSKPAAAKKPATAARKKQRRGKGEDEFWNLVDG
jgi:molecular chaperone DnaK